MFIWIESKFMFIKSTTKCSCKTEIETNMYALQATGRSIFNTDSLIEIHFKICPGVKVSINR